MSDYDRIAAVIQYLDENQKNPPDLEALASAVSLSVTHLHRLFSTWTDITPQEFIQTLTFSDVQQRLLDGNRVLELRMQTGFPESGRLYDRSIQLVEATPGETKAGGTGWTITAGNAETPFGSCFIAEGPRGICHFSFGCDAAWDDLLKHWPNAKFVHDVEMAMKWVDQTFSTRSTETRPIKVYVVGSSFQKKVWAALLQIPEGYLASYGRLAEFVGHPNAARAVGTAVGTNPIGYLIPCHRVIRETGVVGGYRWGSARKKAILSWEARAVDTTKKGALADAFS